MVGFQSVSKVVNNLVWLWSGSYIISRLTSRTQGSNKEAGGGTRPGGGAAVLAENLSWAKTEIGELGNKNS